MADPTTGDAADGDPKTRGSVVHIHVAPDRKPAPMEAVEAVEAVADRGLRGDRYFKGTGKHNVRDDLVGTDVTLITAEAIEAFNRDHEATIEPGQTRRNVTTRDVPLNHLVGRRFRIGEARFIGVAMCEPCGPIADWIGDEAVVQGLTHQGGLNANVIETGMIRVGDAIRY